MKQRLKACVMLMLCAALLCSAAAAAAETALRAWVGYDTVILSGRWFPLFVEITANDEPVEGMVTVDIGADIGMVDRLRQPVSVQAGETRMYRLPICPMVNQRTFEVQLSCGEDVIRTTVRASRAVSEDALIIGVLGKETAQLAQALSAMEQRDVHGTRQVIAAIPLDAEGLAQDARELSAFDAMVVLDGMDRALDGKRVSALEGWRKAGGIFVRRSSADLAMRTTGTAAQEILSAITTAQINGQGLQRENGNYRFSSSLNAAMTADRPNGLWPAAAVLAVYVLAAGVGAYGLMNRLDRSKMLWAVIPAMAMAACGAMAVLGAELRLNQPMSSSVHLVHYAADGQAAISELATLTYAGQERRVVSTQGSAPLERRTYGYFNGYAELTGEPALRDVITLGEEPSIELEGKADWLVRSLVVRNEAAPEGSVTAFAHMEKDGLYVEVENNTDTAIENAVLITGIGYAHLGDLAPGDAVQTVLRRTDESPWTEEGRLVICEQQMLPLGTTTYKVAQAAVDPEAAQDPAWTRSSLPEKKRREREMEESILTLGASAAWQEGFACAVIGQTPQIACETLLLDGKPVTRRAQKSILACTAAFEPVSPSGVSYYPEGTFKRLEATLDKDGVPLLGKELESGYVYEKDEVLLGFSLDGVDTAGIEEIRLYADGGVNVGNEESAIAMEAYDYTSGTWVRLEENGVIRISGALARRVVSPSGALCLRFTGEHLSDWGLRLPDMIVEGCLSAQREGGEAA